MLLKGLEILPGTKERAEKSWPMLLHALAGVRLSKMSLLLQQTAQSENVGHGNPGNSRLQENSNGGAGGEEGRLVDNNRRK